MPVLTRSCGRKGLKTRLEDPTPRKTCRTTGVGRVKRKIIDEPEEAEPPTKKINTRTMGNKNSPGQKRGSRIPRRCTTAKKGKGKAKETNTEDNTVLGTKKQEEPVEEELKGVEQENKSQATNPPSKEKSPEKSKQPPETTPKSEASARTRSYSALKRSLYKKKNAGKQADQRSDPELKSKEAETHTCNVEVEENDAAKARENQPQRMTRNMKKTLQVCLEQCAPSAQERVPSESMEKEDCWAIEKDVDESALESSWSNKDKETVSEQSNDDFYKTKFHVLLQSLKEIQGSFKKAQENAQQNLKAYDAFIQELKHSLTSEKDRTTGLDRELRETKEALAQAQKDMENIKASKENVQDKSIQQDNTEKQDLEKPTEALQQDNSREKAIIKFYSMVTGISLTADDSETTEGFQSYNCVYQRHGANKHMCFNLVYDKEYDELEYRPAVDTPRSKDAVCSLPKYLQESIFFGPDQGPGFLARMLKSVQNL